MRINKSMLEGDLNSSEKNKNKNEKTKTKNNPKVISSVEREKVKNRLLQDEDEFGEEHIDQLDIRIGEEGEMMDNSYI